MTSSQKIEVPEEHWDAMFAPSSCLTIETTVDDEGRVNAAPHATVVRVSHFPMYMAVTVNAFSDTLANVRSTREFVVNVVPFEPEMLRKVRTVGLPFDRHVNEMERAGLTETGSIHVKPPRIQECKVHVECSVEWIHEWEHRAMICGRAVSVSIDEDCYDRKGMIRWSEVKPAHWCGVAYDGNFVPAYEPHFVDITYDGPRDWRPDLAETTAISRVNWSSAAADLDHPNVLET